MPYAFEDEIASLCNDINLLLEQVDDLRRRGTTIFQLRDGKQVDVTEEWLQGLETSLDRTKARFEELLARQREIGSI